MRRRGRDGTLRAVTHVHTEPAAGHAPPAVTVLAATVLALTVLVPVAMVVLSTWASRRKLRGCPLCRAQAVRTYAAETAQLGQLRVSLQCGQCGTWRRVLTDGIDQRAHARRLERDRRGIRTDMLRLEAERRWLDMRAFIALLRSEIVGAEDFLARTRAPVPARGKR
jgi:hypothetical protein